MSRASQKTPSDFLIAKYTIEVNTKLREPCIAVGGAVEVAEHCGALWKAYFRGPIKAQASRSECLLSGVSSPLGQLFVEGLCGCGTVGGGNVRRNQGNRRCKERSIVCEPEYGQHVGDQVER
jgi:hypothetical protein